MTLEVSFQILNQIPWNCVEEKCEWSCWWMEIKSWWSWFSAPFLKPQQQKKKTQWDVFVKRAQTMGNVTRILMNSSCYFLKVQWTFTSHPHEWMNLHDTGCCVANILDSPFQWIHWNDKCCSDKNDFSQRDTCPVSNNIQLLTNNLPKING